MIDSVHFLYILFGIAAVVLIVNMRFRLPKKIFVFLALSILLTTCWVAMNPQAAPSATAMPSRGLVTKILGENLVLNPGDNRFPLVYEEFSGSCIGVAYLLELEAGQGGETVAFPDCVPTLHITDENFIDCSALLFTENALRCVFVFPKDFDFRKISFLKLVCKSNATLNLKRISEERKFN